MSRQEIADALKWAAIEIETGRPNWSEVLKTGIELIREARLLAENQFVDRVAKNCPRCGGQTRA